MSLVVHIAAHADWETQREGDAYTHPSLDEEGFIHCSTPEGAALVANANDVPPDLDLVLLCIETDRLDSEVRWENEDANGGPYPHVYGPIPVDAVVDVVPFPVDEAGSWYVPERVHELAEA